MALAALFARAAQRDLMQHGDIVADDRRFADHDTVGVIDKNPAPELRARMDVRSGQKAREKIEHARKGAQFQFIKSGCAASRSRMFSAHQPG